MKKLMIGLLASSTLLFGCGGGDVCDDLEDGFNALNDKFDACGGGGGEPEKFDKAGCEDALDNCSDSDKDKLSDAAKCLEDLPTPNCNSQEDLEAWLVKLSVCSEKLEDVSPACAAGTGE